LSTVTDKEDPDAVFCVEVKVESMLEVEMVFPPEVMVMVCGVKAVVTTLALSGLGREKMSSSMTTWDSSSPIQALPVLCGTSNSPRTTSPGKMSRFLEECSKNYNKIKKLGGGDMSGK
jgi:hypothetical protein